MIELVFRRSTQAAIVEDGLEGEEARDKRSCEEQQVMRVKHHGNGNREAEKKNN